MRYSIKTRNQLILRDGKPFGEEKNFGGSSYSSIMPQTLAGMIRTSIGFSKSPDYFTTDENIHAILNVAVSKVMYYAQLPDRAEFLTPPPADVIFTKDGEKLKLNQLTFAEMAADCGTDIRNKDWLVPTLDCSEKPAKDVPQRWFWDKFNKYLNERLTNGLDDVGITSMISDIHIHNGLDSKTRSTQEGRLYANKQLYMAAKKQSDGSVVPVEMYFETSEAMPVGDVFLGGERKTVEVEETSLEFPPVPKIFENQRFLKVILMTHGNFGGWCPKWLIPDLNADFVEFVNIPETEYRVRLRSACVSGWDGVSGWDYASKKDGGKGKPKALSKLVRPGTVYLLELDDPSQSADVAKYLWGSSLCDGQAKRDGFGLVVLGLADKQVKV